MVTPPVSPISPVVDETLRIQAGTPKVDETPDFAEALKSAINSVNGLQIDAANKNQQLALGEIKDVHEVMIAGEKANLAMELTLEIRNRVLEAYQAIMRMAV